MKEFYDRSLDNLSSEWNKSIEWMGRWVNGPEHNIKTQTWLQTNADVLVLPSSDWHFFRRESKICLSMYNTCSYVQCIHAIPSPTGLSPSFNPLPPQSSSKWLFSVLFPCWQESVVEIWVSNGLIMRNLVVGYRALAVRGSSMIETRW